MASILTERVALFRSNPAGSFSRRALSLRDAMSFVLQVFFYIDPEFAEDAKMKGINLLTLSYTFFKVEEDD